MINLFTSYYLDKSPIRQQEIDECLVENLINPNLDKIYIFTQEALKIKDSKKHVIIKTNQRETFEEYFTAINKYSGSDDVNIIANSDIKFNESIQRAQAILPEECYALTRWEGERHYGRPDSQDAWIFRGKVKKIFGGYCLGIPGCDNRLAYEIKKAGYALKNPSLDIQVLHSHKSQIRNYNKKKDLVDGPYVLNIPITKLSNRKKILHISLGTDQFALTRALKSMGDYTYIDWTQLQKIGISKLNQLIRHKITNESPDLVFMQIQTPGIILPDTFKGVSSQVVNWTGDVRQPTPQWYSEIGKAIDLTLFSNEYDAKKLRKEGIAADFLNIGFDEKVFTPNGYKEAEGKIVFMGNNYRDKFPLSLFRYKIVHALREEFKDLFQVYGGGWDFQTPNLMNNQAREAAVYRGCSMGVNLSHFDLERYTSDRMFRLMGSGAFCLSHKYKGIKKDFNEGEDLVSWSTVTELIDLIYKYLPLEEERKRIASFGCAKVHALHTWDSRIKELKNLI